MNAFDVSHFDVNLIKLSRTNVFVKMFIWKPFLCTTLCTLNRYVEQFPHLMQKASKLKSALETLWLFFFAIQNFHDHLFWTNWIHCNKKNICKIMPIHQMKFSVYFLVVTMYHFCLLGKDFLLIPSVDDCYCNE